MQYVVLSAISFSFFLKDFLNLTNNPQGMLIFRVLFPWESVH